ncbi:hypothetical protein ACU686_13090 [Yinghuangia aomiensis]
MTRSRALALAAALALPVFTLVPLDTSGSGLQARPSPPRCPR